MTKAEFKILRDRVAEAYPGKEFLTTKNALETWYNEFKEYDFKDVEYAFNEHIKSVEFLPCVANIYLHLRKLQEKRKYDESVIDAFYTNASNNYPGRGDVKTRELFFQKCYETKDPIAAARYMAMVITKNPGEKPLYEFMKETFA